MRKNSGREGKAAGDAFELWVSNQHLRALGIGILAHVEHSEPHARVVGGRVQWVSSGVADFFGTLGGGKSFAAECKSTDKQRLSKAAVEPKQAAHLDAVGRAGGLALLLVEFRRNENGLPVRHRFAVPWLEIKWKVLRSAESVGIEELAGWEVANECYLKRFHPGGPCIAVCESNRYPAE